MPAMLFFLHSQQKHRGQGPLLRKHGMDHLAPPRLSGSR